MALPSFPILLYIKYCSVIRRLFLWATVWPHNFSSLIHRVSVMSGGRRDKAHLKCPMVLPCTERTVRSLCCRNIWCGCEGQGCKSTSRIVPSLIDPIHQSLFESLTLSPSFCGLTQESSNKWPITEHLLWIQHSFGGSLGPHISHSSPWSLESSWAN